MGSLVIRSVLLAVLLCLLTVELVSSEAVASTGDSVQATAGSTVVLPDDTIRELPKKERCDLEYRNVIELEGKGDPFAGVHLLVHRNGQAEPCGSSSEENPVNTAEALRRISHDFWYCPESFTKYDFESLLTLALADLILDEDECDSEEEEVIGLSEGSGRLLTYCDMGEERTPLLPDHRELVPVAENEEDEWRLLPCRFHTREGLRISSLSQLAELAREASEQHNKTCQTTTTASDGDADKKEEQVCPAAPELHLYAVPAGRTFIFAPSYVGERFDLQHVNAPNGLPVYMEVLSIHPRVFDIHNFYTQDEVDDILARALNETDEELRVQRSTTGTENVVNKIRTSDTGWDHHGETSVKVKKRCFQVLGFDEYWKPLGEGLQLLRYNQSKAYISHMDWLDVEQDHEEHDYNSAGKGSNRVATILLYLSDLGENGGGETVFTEAWPPGMAEEDRKDIDTAIRELRESGDAADLVEEGSWEERMVAQCRTRLAVKPSSARAVLFYSQHPNGVEDEMANHGGCPVLNGTKWAANLWVWNAAERGEFEPINENYVGPAEDEEEGDEDSEDSEDWDGKDEEEDEETDSE